MDDLPIRDPLLDLEAVAQLVQLRGSTDCVAYYENVTLDHRSGLRASIFGAQASPTIFVEVTDGRNSRVKSFQSRFLHFPPELRAQELPLVDISDAFALARTLSKRWPEPRRQ